MFPDILYIIMNTHTHKQYLGTTDMYVLDALHILYVVKHITNAMHIPDFKLSILCVNQSQGMFFFLQFGPKWAKESLPGQ